MFPTTLWLAWTLLASIFIVAVPGLLHSVDSGWSNKSGLPVTSTDLLTDLAKTHHKSPLEASLVLQNPLFDNPMPGLKGWHQGERTIQQKLGHAQAMAAAFMWIDGEMPEQHREFYSNRLPFVPVTTLDKMGRPWGSILAAADGEPGFIQSPTESKLVIKARVWEGDPFLDNANLFHEDHPLLAAGIGVEFTTRRRNKFAGHITKLQRTGNNFDLEMFVNEAIGNCPKYINIRDLVAHPHTSPKILHSFHTLLPSERLPDEIIRFILDADTVFIGTSYDAPKEDATKFPSHVGMNQRGGRQGYIRVFPSDGRTIVLPDYSGNRLMTSLGNIEVTPLASLTFISFSTGDVLYLTGEAKTLVGPDAHEVMPFQPTLTTIKTTGYTFVADALPVRQRLGTTVERSPYSPPIRLLAEESSGSVSYLDAGKEVTANLTKIKMLSPSIATFVWVASEDLEFTPGQAAIMDFTPLLGREDYHHMAPGKPTSVNDDRIRTWTISSPPSNSKSRAYELTMREKAGGAVTGALFSMARKISEFKPELLDDMTPLEINVKLVGISGDFTLPKEPRKSYLWMAGGIGVTPFLSMLSSAQFANVESPVHITLALSSREPDILLKLLSSTLIQADRISLTVHTFGSHPSSTPVDSRFTVHPHSGRIDRSFLEEIGSDIHSSPIYLCGPPAFESAVLTMLGDIGVETKAVRRENFAY